VAIHFTVDLRAMLLGLVLVLGAVSVPYAISRAAGGDAREAEGQRTPVGSGFTYHGQLQTPSGPASGPHDFIFRLYPEPVGGAVLGTVTKPAEAVVNGTITLELQFGLGNFVGQELWLDVQVRPALPPGLAYEQLTPRQKLTPTPYALYALAAPWSGIRDVPPSIADGDNDTTYSAGAGLQLAANQFSIQFAGTGSANSAARSDHSHSVDPGVSGFINRFGTVGDPGQRGGCGIEANMGGIYLIVGSTPSSGAVVANGQTLPINTNQALFSLYQFRFGGNGVSTFAMPDLSPIAPNGMSYVVCTVGNFPPPP
jgi:hypothetical protein